MGSTCTQTEVCIGSKAKCAERGTMACLGWCGGRRSVLQCRLSGGRRLFAAGLLLVPSHPAFAKAVGPPAKRCRVQEKPLGLSTSFFNLTLKWRANLFACFLWGVSALPAHPSVPIIYPGSPPCSNALPAHIHGGSNKSIIASVFGGISVLFTLLKCLTSQITPN